MQSTASGLLHSAFFDSGGDTNDEAVAVEIVGFLLDVIGSSEEVFRGFCDCAKVALGFVVHCDCCPEFEESVEIDESGGHFDSEDGSSIGGTEGGGGRGERDEEEGLECSEGRTDVIEDCIWEEGLILLPAEEVA